MSTGANSTAARLVPTLRYRDIAAAVDWLCSAFGFKRLRVITGVDGSIQQAHLAFGSDIIMLLPARDFGTDAAPDLAVAELQSCYFVVDDADQHHRNAKAFGAEILDIRQYDLGGRGYSCRDPEGHLWSFGTYNPRQRQFDPAAEDRPDFDPWTARLPKAQKLGHAVTDATVRLRPRITLTSVTTALATLVVSAATIGWLLGALPQPAASARDTQDSKLVNRLVDDGSGKAADSSTARAAEKPQDPQTQVPDRTQARPLLFGTAAVQQRPAAEEEKPASPRAPQLVKDPPPEPAANMAAAHQVNERDQEKAAQEAAEQAAHDAIKQWREAQERLRQLARERSVKEAAEQAELESRQRAAKAAAAAHKRAVAAKEAPKPAVKPTPAKPTAHEGVVVQTAKADAAKAAGPKAAQPADGATWDCPTDPATGKVACSPREKKPAAARAPEAPLRTSKMGSVESSRAEPPRKTEPTGSTSSDQVWDCVPRPPENKVIGHPIPNRP